MANISTYLEGKWLNMLKGTAYTAPTVYCGIVSDTATDTNMEDGVLTNEITGYTGNRPAITLGTVSQVGTPPNDKATVKNSAAIDFLVMPAPAGRQVKYGIVCDAATSGNILYWMPITGGPKVWNDGDTFRIPVDGLVMDLA